MAKVNICNVVVKDNPCSFGNPFQFEITFECSEALQEDLEWKIIYVGSAESEEYDQVLDTVLVGPLCEGRHMFVFEADPPDVSKIPREDALGVTVVLLTCCYHQSEFIRVGYYVNNDYLDPELKENPPVDVDYEKVQRNILATCPRVTRFKIDWGDSEATENVQPAVNPENESNQMLTNNEIGFSELRGFSAGILPNFPGFSKSEGGFSSSGSFVNEGGVTGKGEGCSGEVGSLSNDVDSNLMIAD